MPQKPIELILFRQLADYLSLPIFIVDPVGNLLYYNEATERMLGIKYSETGEMPVQLWTSIFEPQDKDGNLIPPEQLPLVQSFQYHRPAHDSFYIKAKDNILRFIEVSTLPIINNLDIFLGAVAFFPEKKM